MMFDDNTLFLLVSCGETLKVKNKFLPLENEQQNHHLKVDSNFIPRNALVLSVKMKENF